MLFNLVLRNQKTRNEAIMGIENTGLTIEKERFDYSVLSADTETLIKQCELEIEDVLTGTSYRIGKILINVKDQLEHGLFLNWIEKKFGWSKSTAYNMMNIAENFKLPPDGSLVSKSAQNLLAAPSTPESARETMRERTKANIPTSKKDAEKMKRLSLEAERLKKENDKLREEQEPKKPNLDNLIPQLNKLYRGETLMPNMAEYASTWEPEIQEAFYYAIEPIGSYRKEIDRAKEKAQEASDTAIRYQNSPAKNKTGGTV